MSSLNYVSAQLGTTFEVDGPDIFTQMALPIRSNQWKYEIGSNALLSVQRNAREVDCDVHFTSAYAFDTFTQAADADMRAGTPGMLIADGEWTQRAYIVGWTPSERFENGMTGSGKFILLDGVWRRVTTVTLNDSLREEIILGDLDLDVPEASSGSLDLYNLDLGAGFLGTTMEIESVGGALLRIRFQGPCSNPYVNVAGNLYRVNADANTGEQIIIDPLGRDESQIGRSVYRVDVYGNTTNMYANRERGAEGSGHYVFQRVPGGTQYVTWSSGVTIYLDVIDERGMPPWNS